MNFWKSYFNNLKKIGWLLLALHIIASILDNFLTQSVQTQVSARSTSEAVVWSLAIFSVVTSIIFPMTYFILVCACLQNKSPLRFFAKHFQQNLIEQFRAWGKVILWSLLLIIPGLIKFIQLSFVPLIVNLDSRYEQGEIDALQASQAISKRVKFKLTALIIGFTLLIPLALSDLDAYSQILVTPLPAFFIEVFETLMTLLFIHWLYKIYQTNTNKEVVHGTHV